MLTSRSSRSPAPAPVQTPRHVGFGVTAALLSTVVMSGCGEAKDEFLIEETRLLAIRTEVVASIFDQVPTDPALPKKAQALPFETVRIEPYLTNPAGVVDLQLFDPVWLACELFPSQGLGSCLQRQFPLKLAEIPHCGDVSVTLEQLILGAEPQASLPPCRIDVAPGDPRYTGPAPIPEWAIPFTFNGAIGGSIEVTMVTGVPGLNDTASCLKPYLAGEYELPDGCIYGLQRISVGPTARLNTLASDAGLPGLPPTMVGDDATAIQADLNPRITSFTATIRDPNDVKGAPIPITPGMTIQATDGDVLELEVISPKEDLQEYAVFVNNGESSESRFEAYEGRWYRSWGTLQSGQSDDPVSRNEWTLEDDDPYPEPPTNGIATLWYVVRDGRQGVAWFHFNVAVAPRPE